MAILGFPPALHDDVSMTLKKRYHLFPHRHRFTLYHPARGLIYDLFHQCQRLFEFLRKLMCILGFLLIPILIGFQNPFLENRINGLTSGFGTYGIYRIRMPFRYSSPVISAPFSY